MANQLSMPYFDNQDAKSPSWMKKTLGSHGCAIEDMNDRELETFDESLIADGLHYEVLTASVSGSMLSYFQARTSVRKNRSSLLLVALSLS